ncbi:MAG: hypothetical protein M3067_05800 [Chloroflexota bacterium]|nr:hypothetical protein [Chloroflexota bacterium]
MSTVDHKAAHFWTKMASGLVRCAYVGCPARPSPAEVEKLEAEIATAARMRIHLDMSAPTGGPGTPEG